MSRAIANRFLQLELDLENAAWSVTGAALAGAAIRKASLRLEYQLAGKRVTTLKDWSRGEIETSQAFDAAQAGVLGLRPAEGPLCSMSLHLPGNHPDEPGCRVVFVLPEYTAGLFWRVELENTTRSALYIDRIHLLVGAALGADQPSRAGVSPNPTKFYSNGWQSWSYAGAFGPGSRFIRTRLGPLRAPTDVNAGTPQPSRPGHFASDMFGVLGSTSSALLAGFLSQRQQFGSLEARLDGPRPELRLWANGDHARLDPGAVLHTDWACLYWLDPASPDPLGPYVEAVARQHGLVDLEQHPVPTGWCSWYQYSTEQYTGAVSAADIDSNLQALSGLRSALPLQVVQVDDGFEAVVGDWFSFSPGFPQGMKLPAGHIHQAGFTPGLWLAPFIVDPHSRLAGDHPDWLLRGRLGRLANAGYLWNTFATALDLTHPAALEYAASTVHAAVHDWGYTYLKLDFLYAGALPGKRCDPTLSRAQVLQLGVQALRQAAGRDAVLLGCACPLGAGLGWVDAMRIGADTARRWKPAFGSIQRPLELEPNVPAVRNALHNAITRAPLHRRWWINDPDCLLLNPRPTLSLDEVRTAAAVIALTGGSLLLSDDLAHLPPERLRIAQALLPLIGLRPQVLDWLEAGTPSRLRLDLDGPTGPWHLLGLFNWDDHPQELSLHLGKFNLEGAAWLGREFWSGLLWNEPLVFLQQAGPQPLRVRIPAHGCQVWALRQVPEHPQGAPLKKPVYLGSDLHISQGLEVLSWQEAPGRVELRLERPAPSAGNVFLHLPGAPHAWLEGIPLDPTVLPAPGCYFFPVSFASGAAARPSLQVEWK